MEGVMRRAAAVGLASLAVACGAAGERPGVAFLPEMYRSVPYDAYDANPATANGQTLQLPPEGTIPMDPSAVFPYGPGPEEAQRAARTLVNPLPASPENVARGEAVYRNVCIVCHGPKGEGDGPIIGRFPNPPSLLAARARGLPDGHVYHIVTRGQGIMASHAVQVQPDDRWRVIHYVRALQAAGAGR
jgi:mono/diheme cytochrome c family protein